MSKERFDFSTLDLTEKRVNDIAQDYISKVIVKDYYSKQIIFDAPMNVHFVRFLKAYLQSGEIEKNEYWVKEDMGFDGDGWQHICQKLYKKHNKYNAQLHIVIDVYLKKKGLFGTDKRRKYGFWKAFFYTFLGLNLMDSAIYGRQGKSSFMGDFFASFLMFKYFNNENRKAEQEDYAFNDQ